MRWHVLAISWVCAYVHLTGLQCTDDLEIPAIPKCPCMQGLMKEWAYQSMALND